MVEERLIRWLAYGLNTSMTGIERVIALQAAELLTALPAGYSLEVVADEGATWVEELPRDPRVRVAAVHRPGLGVAGRAGPRDRSGVFTHSFGPRLPKVGHGGYSIWDWGPLRDRAMPTRARAAWSVAMVSSRRADYVHCLSADVVRTAPRFFRRLPWLISPPPSPPAAPGPSTEPGSTLLFVGSVSARKRLDLLTAAAVGGRLPPVLLAGSGTSALTSPGVTGLGRVTEAELDALYDDCLAVVLMSDYEGLGLPVEEAARRGRRSIVSRQVADQQAADLQPYLLVVEQTPEAIVAAAARLTGLPAIEPLAREPHLNDLTSRMLEALR